MSLVIHKISFILYLETACLCTIIPLIVIFFRNYCENNLVLVDSKTSCIDSTENHTFKCNLLSFSTIKLDFKTQ